MLFVFYVHTLKQTFMSLIFYSKETMMSVGSVYPANIQILKILKSQTNRQTQTAQVLSWSKIKMLHSRVPTRSPIIKLWRRRPIKGMKHYNTFNSSTSSAKASEKGCKWCRLWCHLLTVTTPVYHTHGVCPRVTTLCTNEKTSPRGFTLGLKKHCVCTASKS